MCINAMRTAVPARSDTCRRDPGVDDGAEVQRVVNLLEDRLEAAMDAVPARLRRWIPAALLQLAVGRSAPQRPS